MKKIVLSVWLAVSLLAINAQNLVNDQKVVDYRKNLCRIDTLMQKGIMNEEVSGMDYFTGYAYKTLYDWDQYFESIVQIYMGWKPDYIKNGVLIFLKNQQTSGLISRSVPSTYFHDAEHVKPFLAQIALLVYTAYGESDWITSDTWFPKLRKYLDYWLYEMDENKNGLSEWMSAPHTGMDNQHERAGFWHDRNCEGVDLNCYLVRETQAFARLAEIAGDKKTAKKYRELAEARKTRINDLLWDEEDGFYYDRKKDKDQPMARSLWEGAGANSRSAGSWKIPVRYVGAFAPLWAGVASEEQAESMVMNYLTNPREFWTPYPLATLSKSEPWYSTRLLPADNGCSWRANTWMPTNYMVYHGLKWYGYDHIATALAHRSVELIEHGGDREYFNSETGEGIGLDPFWGWSLLGHFFMLEEELDWDLNAIED